MKYGKMLKYFKTTKLYIYLNSKMPFKKLKHINI